MGGWRRSDWSQTISCFGFMGVLLVKSDKDFSGLEWRVGNIWRDFRRNGGVVVLYKKQAAIGRWGNYFNQELYGLPTKLFWGIYIRPENRLLEVFEYERFHPLFLYESLWSLFIFGMLIWLVNKKKVKLGEGKLFIYYLGLYGFGRFWLEWLRIESWKVYGLNVAQVISIGLVGMAVFWLKKRG